MVHVRHAMLKLCNKCYSFLINYCVLTLLIVELVATNNSNTE